MNDGGKMQLTLFGAPEPVGSYGKSEKGRGDDLPAPCERELLWPACLLEELMGGGATHDEAAAILDRLYGDLPRRTRLRTDEVCRRLRCDSNVVYRHRESGALPAVDVSAGAGITPEWRFYRAGLVFFLASREFGPVPTRTDAAREDSDRMARAVARARK
jgi:hypothetical protein